VRHYALAVAGGDLRSVGRAAVALVHPAVGTDRLFAFLDRDSNWIADAERWIEAFAPNEDRKGSSR